MPGCLDLSRLQHTAYCVPVCRIRTLSCLPAPLPTNRRGPLRRRGQETGAYRIESKDVCTWRNRTFETTGTLDFFVLQACLLVSSFVRSFVLWSRLFVSSSLLWCTGPAVREFSADTTHTFGELRRPCGHPRGESLFDPSPSAVSSLCPPYVVLITLRRLCDDKTRT